MSEAQDTQRLLARVSFREGELAQAVRKLSRMPADSPRRLQAAADVDKAKLRLATARRYMEESS